MDSARLFPPKGVSGAWRDKGVTKSALDITADVHNLSNAWHNLYSKTSVRGRLVTGVDKISILDFKAAEKKPYFQSPKV
ncbi:hypothetical protein HORIV_35490 [Vreelandella olivaria]|uniref:Uncharacterized protein n=1 Tax=Vreelandella olivaria TaxID=390919 RepID=A0ABM7GKP0_9GAMM|nr:hypothetical protein HORIV_35490 [Halomonas olivaria]